MGITFAIASVTLSRLTPREHKPLTKFASRPVVTIPTVLIQTASADRVGYFAPGLLSSLMNRLRTVILQRQYENVVNE